MSIESRLEELERITGAITEALNDKTDRDARNLSGGGKALISGLGMPKETGTALTWGASGTTYTAPSSGWFSIYAGSPSGQNVYVTLQNMSTPIELMGGTFAWPYGGLGEARLYCPVKKGDVVRILYNGSFGNKFIYFIPSVGGEE